jgi:hypothetical protein|uniref:Uncharacterized protein n=1 Tax=Picea glauca TaxID=3330 RepID=A0A117NGV3_PICGL|nr:hypothetical protein ABT39_MTgene5575 [Picea glauca]QHR89573.1 hypothetical protein Q903MT_gene3595 [Picea sitchensis]
MILRGAAWYELLCMPYRHGFFLCMDTDTNQHMKLSQTNQQDYIFTLRDGSTSNDKGALLIRSLFISLVKKMEWDESSVISLSLLGLVSLCYIYEAG